MLRLLAVQFEPILSAANGARRTKLRCPEEGVSLPRQKDPLSLLRSGSSGAGSPPPLVFPVPGTRVPFPRSLRGDVCAAVWRCETPILGGRPEAPALGSMSKWDSEPLEGAVVVDAAGAVFGRAPGPGRTKTVAENSLETCPGLLILTALTCPWKPSPFPCLCPCPCCGRLSDGDPPTKPSRSSPLPSVR